VHKKGGAGKEENGGEPNLKDHARWERKVSAAINRVQRETLACATVSGRG